MTAELVKKCLIPRLILRNFTIWTVLALEKVVPYCFWVPREINSRFFSKTQWQMFLLVSGRHVCVPPKGTNMASPYKAPAINLGDTLLRIAREWKTAETEFLARLLILQSSIIFQMLEFIYWMVTFFILITWLVKTENIFFHISQRKFQWVKRTF